VGGKVRQRQIVVGRRGGTECLHKTLSHPTASAPSQTQEGFRWTFIKYEGAKGFLPSLSAGEASGREEA